MKNVTLAFALLLLAVSPVLGQTRFTRSATTVADMLAQNPASIHTNVLLSGYYAANDGGGGNFEVWPYDGTATNRGMVFRSLQNPNFLLKRVPPDNRISVRWFGARPGDATYDHIPIQDAAHWASNNLQVLYIPPGTYTINAPLHFDSSVESGAGARIQYSGPTNTPFTMITIGKTNGLTGRTGMRLEMPEIVSYNWPYSASTAANTNIICVRVIGIYDCQLYFPLVWGGGIGIQVDGGPASCSGSPCYPNYFNTFHLGSIFGNSRGLNLLNGCNQNTFTGGQVNGFDYDDGAGGWLRITNNIQVYLNFVNNNTFRNVNLEGRSMDWFIYSTNSGRNLFDWCRYENQGVSPWTNSRVMFGASDYSYGEGNLINGGYMSDNLHYEGNATGLAGVNAYGARRGWQLNAYSPNSAPFSVRNLQGASAPAFAVWDPAYATPELNKSTLDTNWTFLLTGQDARFRYANETDPWLAIESYSKRFRISYGTNSFTTTNLAGTSTNYVTNTPMYHNIGVLTSPVTEAITNALSAVYFLSDWKNHLYNNVSTNLEIFGNDFYSDLRVGGIGIGVQPTVTTPINLYRAVPDEFLMRMQNSSPESDGVGFWLLGPNLADDGDVHIKYYGSNIWTAAPNWTNRLLVLTGGASKGITLQTPSGSESSIDLAAGGWLPALGVTNNTVVFPLLNPYIPAENGMVLKLGAAKAVVEQSGLHVRRYTNIWEDPPLTFNTNITDRIHLSQLDPTNSLLYLSVSTNIDVVTIDNPNLITFADGHLDINTNLLVGNLPFNALQFTNNAGRFDLRTNLLVGNLPFHPDQFINNSGVLNLDTNKLVANFPFNTGQFTNSAGVFNGVSVHGILTTFSNTQASTFASSGVTYPITIWTNAFSSSLLRNCTLTTGGGIQVPVAGYYAISAQFSASGSANDVIEFEIRKNGSALPARCASEATMTVANTIGARSVVAHAQLVANDIITLEAENETDTDAITIKYGQLALHLLQ